MENSPLRRLRSGLRQLSYHVRLEAPHAPSPKNWSRNTARLVYHHICGCICEGSGRCPSAERTLRYDRT